MKRYVCYIGTHGQKDQDSYFEKIKNEVTEQGKFGSTDDSAIIFLANPTTPYTEIMGLPN